MYASVVWIDHLTGLINRTLTVNYRAIVNADSTADVYIIDHIEYNMYFKEETLISHKVILSYTYNDVM